MNFCKVNEREAKWTEKCEMQRGMKKRKRGFSEKTQGMLVCACVFTEEVRARKME